jgi:hypothetical protein
LLVGGRPLAITNRKGTVETVVRYKSRQYVRTYPALSLSQIRRLSTNHDDDNNDAGDGYYSILIRKLD